MKRLALWSIGIALAALAALAHAQAWPSKPIHIVAPSTPGDAPDVIARLVADKLSVALGKEVVVDRLPRPRRVAHEHGMQLAGGEGITGPEDAEAM